MRLLFDIETNGLPRQGLDHIHCVVAKDIDSGQVFRFNDTGSANSVTNGITLLQEADVLIGHNIVGFDIPVIQQIYPFFQTKATLFDTLILSRMFYPDILSRDFRKKPIGMPPKLFGRHSLEAWGYRLGDYKGEFGKTTDWADWSQEMENYCEQDVHVCDSLFQLMGQKDRLARYADSIGLEHDLATIMAKQEVSGWPFDVVAAQKLEATLRTEMDQLADKMRETFPYVDGGQMTPKRPNQTRGYIKDAPFTKLKEFNPTSRDHIGWAFMTWRGWQPEVFTDSGRPKIDEGVLMGIDTEEAKIFARILELQKALGQLSDGANAWLKVVTKEGRIHHVCQLATNTGRNAHSRPNLGQTSSDPRCRKLFLPGKGMAQVGADASGLELRMLGHYLSYFDGGAFADVVVNGDIHQQNADRVGCSRKDVKTLTYAFIYGASDKKIGVSLDKSLDDKKAAALGKEIRNKFLEAIPGLEDLLNMVNKKSASDVLRGLDGRPILLQGKKHAALNYLLQSAGAIVCKRWNVITYNTINELGYQWGVDYQWLGWIHDEIQLAVQPHLINDFKFQLEWAIVQAGEYYKLKVPLASEAKSGLSWADCH
jgi:DNA polymerase I-like protein with 3'-5' exonuclease and polymerase domains